jgi:uncharacterized protein involved in outer membrane biogenesis
MTKMNNQTTLKKTLKIAGIVIALVLAAMVLAPFLFKNQIKKAVVEAANKKLNAKLSVKDFGLNFFSNFPNATLSLNNASLVGVGDFASDTLFKAKSASVTIDLSSLFGGNYRVTQVSLDQTHIYAKLLADGRANWDIMKVDSSATAAPEDTAAMAFNVQLKKISLTDCSVVYEDQASNMKMILDKWSGNVSGDFSAATTTINTESSANELSFYMENIPYLYKVKTTANASIKADLNKFTFSFIESKLEINEVKASIDGSFAMLTGEDGMEFDLKLKAPDTQFKDILSLLPAMYTSDFKNVKTSGTASLDAYFKGVMKGEEYPAFDLKLLVKDGMFQYPSLPKSVTAINVDMKIVSPGGPLDNTVVDISKFNFSMGGNPFAAQLRVSTPISDPNLQAKMDGVLDLGMIKDIYPLEKGTELSGRLDANLALATRMSYIEKEEYSKVNASGGLKVTGLNYRSAAMPLVKVNSVVMQFSPQYVNLANCDVKIGRNDIQANGRLDNLLAYALNNKTLKGHLDMTSSYLNLNDFMTETTSSTTAAADAPMATVEVPKNIDFTLTGKMKQVVYEKVNMTNVSGIVTVKDGVVSFKNVGGNAMGGTLQLNGSYSTAADPKKAKVDMDMKMSNVEFAQAFKSIEMVQKFAPIFEKIGGNFSMGLKMNTEMGTSYTDMLKTLTMTGLIQSSDMKVQGTEVLNSLSSALKTDALKSLSVKDLNLPFTINNGRVATKPFTISANGGKLNLSGSTGLDQTIDYAGTVTLPKAIANKYVDNVGITIGGTFTKPKIGIDTKSLLSGAVNSASKQLLGTSVDDKKQQLKQQASAEAAKQAQRIREEAKEAADRLVAEAEKNAQKLVDASSNPLAKIAAKKAAEKLVVEAKKNAQRLIDEAEAKAAQVEGAVK